MKTHVIVDAGPLVAMVDKQDQYHKWAVGAIHNISIPMFTCESAISEALFILRHAPRGIPGILKLLHNGTVRIAHSLALEENVHRVCEILSKYSNLPASLADACLVRMSDALMPFREYLL